MRTKPRTPEYISWASMRQRCNDQNHRWYKRYGGRGIRVCDRWSSFAAFLADMGARPSGCRLERIDNDGNYEPGNCRWASHLEQMRNTSCNVRVSVGGEEMIAADWAEAKGMKRGTLGYRLRSGWDPRKAVEAPVLDSRRYIEHGGERLHLNEWSRRTGIRAGTIRWRLEHDWSVADALGLLSPSRSSTSVTGHPVVSTASAAGDQGRDGGEAG